MRVAFSTAMIMTPTSAKIAHHILTKPIAPNPRHANLTASAKTIFWCTIPSVFLEDRKSVV